MALYHKDLGLPIEGPKGTYKLSWSNHAIRESLNDELGKIPAFDTLVGPDYDLIEVELVDNRPVKMVLRRPYDDELDVVIVVIPRPGKWIVKTVWFNYAWDQHDTPKGGKYTRLKQIK